MTCIGAAKIFTYRFIRVTGNDMPAPAAVESCKTFVRLLSQNYSRYLLAVFLACSMAGADDEWRLPFTPDEHTVVLYHFDEGGGNVTHDALGDTELTLRAKRGLWGKRAGFGSTARFERHADDGNVLVGPVDNDKLHLRSCTREWTIEAWVRYTGPVGEDGGDTYANIAGTDDEGFSLPIGFRGGWNFALWNRPTLSEGTTPVARFIGSLRRKDPNHDTSGLLFPHQRGGGYTGSQPAHITDQQWHHVAWQFRYRDQTHFFYLDGQVVRKVQLPFPGDQQGKVINDATDVVVPFVVGGFIHSQDPPFYLEFGNFEGEIDELRISSIMRYPVAHELAIVRETPPKAGLNLPYKFQLATDAAKGKVAWKLIEGALPRGLTLDAIRGAIQGRPQEIVEDRKATIEAEDSSGKTDQHTFAITVAPGRIVTESLPPSFSGSAYRASLQTIHAAEPLRWQVSAGNLPEGISLDAQTGILSGVPLRQEWAKFAVQLTDANGLQLRQALLLKVLPKKLRTIKPDENTVVLYDWQGPNGRFIKDLMGDEELTLTWTNMGGDRRISWPGREGRFPQFVGHGEHGFVITGKGNPKLDLKTCTEAWTVEAWVRRGGPFRAFGDRLREHNQPFDYGHIMGSYDNTERGVWELYLSDSDSPDGSMAVGVHFLGADPDQALMDLHPWKRPEGVVGELTDAGISDIEWHHVAWQYNYADDLHQLFLDGRLIWRMKSPDGRRLVNNRQHDAQFSITTRLDGYAKYGGGFNYLGFGNFFGQIGEIRISDVLRYGSADK